MIEFLCALYIIGIMLYIIVAVITELRYRRLMGAYGPTLRESTITICVAIVLSLVWPISWVLLPPSDDY